MKFWIKKIEGYPILSETVLRVLMPYPSTYMCENAFSTLLVIKSKARNRLEAKMICDVLFRKQHHELKGWYKRNSSKFLIENTQV